MRIEPFSWLPWWGFALAIIVLLAIALVRERRQTGKWLNEDEWDEKKFREGS